MPNSNASQPGVYYHPEQDAVVVKLFGGDRTPAALQGALLELEAGPTVLVHVDPAGWLAMVTLLEAARWLPEGSVAAGSAELRVFEVSDEEDAVVLELIPGGVGDGGSTHRLEIGGIIELEVIYNHNQRVVGILVLRASQTLSPLMRPH